MSRNIEMSPQFHALVSAASEAKEASLPDTFRLDRSVSPAGSDNRQTKRLKLAKRKCDVSGGSSCHQCKSRRNFQDLTYCTSNLNKKNKTAVCRKKYCEHCLKKFYKENPSTASRSTTWRCPSCRNICCCAACRRREQRDKPSPKSSPTMSEPPSPLDIAPNRSTSAIPSFTNLPRSSSSTTASTPASSPSSSSFPSSQYLCFAAAQLPSVQEHIRRVNQASATDVQKVHAIAQMIGLTAQAVSKGDTNEKGELDLSFLSTIQPQKITPPSPFSPSDHVLSRSTDDCAVSIVGKRPRQGGRPRSYSTGTTGTVLSTIKSTEREKGKGSRRQTVTSTSASSSVSIGRSLLHDRPGSNSIAASPLPTRQGPQRQAKRNHRILGNHSNNNGVNSIPTRSANITPASSPSPQPKRTPLPSPATPSATATAAKSVNSGSVTRKSEVLGGLSAASTVAASSERTASSLAVRQETAANLVKTESHTFQGIQ